MSAVFVAVGADIIRPSVTMRFAVTICRGCLWRPSKSNRISDLCIVYPRTPKGRPYTGEFMCAHNFMLP